MLDDVAAFLLIAPLAGTLLAVLVVSAWLLKGRNAGPEPSLEDLPGQ
ncbi:MAG: hypothetical protein M3O95_09255 [Candidatus Dormibacteraeota bacterium]|jgi:hypothetical protein|nr:hypothetical protein [Candidatus Dormibacteraeota bacterium]